LNALFPIRSVSYQGKGVGVFQEAPYPVVTSKYPHVVPIKIYFPAPVAELRRAVVEIVKLLSESYHSDGREVSCQYQGDQSGTVSRANGLRVK
jgi:hypothetical protein